MTQRYMIIPPTSQTDRFTLLKIPVDYPCSIPHMKYEYNIYSRKHARLHKLYWESLEEHQSDNNNNIWQERYKKAQQKYPEYAI